MRNYLVLFEKGVALMLLSILSLFGNDLSAQITVYPYFANDKKVIILQGSEYWDWSSNIKDNLESMQSSQPSINGLVFHVGPNYGRASYAFNNEVWSESSLRFDELKMIANKWTTFTDNFILVWGHARNTDVDFFNDEHWSQIIKNTELLGKAVKTAGCKGILFDPEFYSSGETYSPWWFSMSGKFIPPYVGRGTSFKDASAKARQRGREYVQALQVHMPDITILTTFLHSGAWCYCNDDKGKLSGTKYALLAAFADGMFEALNPGATIIDGNEPSFYIDETRKFVENSDQTDYKFCRIDAPKGLCDTEVIKKWNKQGQVAMSTYMDLCYNRYSPDAWNTPDYQSKWMTHNVYNSLMTTDKYVWIYIERMDFWTGENAPEGVDVYSDINMAVDKFRKGEALGYDMYKTANNFQYHSEIQAQFIYEPLVTLSVQAKDEIPGNMAITANVDPATSIISVQFYINSLLAGSVFKAPYTLTRLLADSTYTITARAFKKDGTHTTSAPLALKPGLVNNEPDYNLKNPLGFKMYPNPLLTGFLTIQIPKNTLKNSHITIIDSSGRLIYAQTLNSFEKELKIPYETFGYKGTFLISLESGGSVANHKLEVL